MRKSAQVEMQSVALLQRHAADRPSFEVLRRGAFSGARAFQAFALPRGLLFLELRTKAVAGPSSHKAALVGGIMGGAIGACVGALIDSRGAVQEEREAGFDMWDEDRLIELAGLRKRSFVSKYDEIRSVSLDAPGSLGRMFADRDLAGWMTLYDRVLGKVVLEFHDPSAMAVAVDGLPRRLGDKVRVNVELDESTARFVRRRG